MVFTDVPPSINPTLYVVFPHPYWCLSHKIMNHIRSHRNRIGRSKICIGMSTSSPNTNLITSRTDSPDGSRIVSAIVRNQLPDSSCILFHKSSASLQIAKSLLTGIQGKTMVCFGTIFSQINISKSSESHTHWWYHPNSRRLNAAVFHKQPESLSHQGKPYPYAP